MDLSLKGLAEKREEKHNKEIAERLNVEAESILSTLREKQYQVNEAILILRMAQEEIQQRGAKHLGNKYLNHIFE